MQSSRIRKSQATIFILAGLAIIAIALIGTGYYAYKQIKQEPIDKGLRLCIEKSSKRAIFSSAFEIRNITGFLEKELLERSISEHAYNEIRNCFNATTEKKGIRIAESSVNISAAIGSESITITFGRPYIIKKGNLTSYPKKIVVTQELPLGKMLRLANDELTSYYNDGYIREFNINGLQLLVLDQLDYGLWLIRDNKTGLRLRLRVFRKEN